MTLHKCFLDWLLCFLQSNRPEHYLQPRLGAPARVIKWQYLLALHEPASRNPGQCFSLQGKHCSATCIGWTWNQSPWVNPLYLYMGWGTCHRDVAHGWWGCGGSRFDFGWGCSALPVDSKCYKGPKKKGGGGGGGGGGGSQNYSF